VSEKPPANRKELFERIARGSKDAVILDEMKRLGFWPQAQSLPDQPADEVERLAAARSRLAELAVNASRLRNLAEIERQAKKQRMAESRAKRQANKQKRLGDRAVKRGQWQTKKTQELNYLGANVSVGLGSAQSTAADKPSSLQALGLPLWQTAADIARAMNIPLGALRHLAFAREVSTINHYKRFSIAKKSGGVRIISAPHSRLKRAQRFINDELLAKFPLSAVAHGFAPGRSIVSNALPHLGAAVLINVDLRDFFPTVTYRRVKGLFRSIGYNEEVAIVLALLCTEPEIAETQLDGVTYYVARGERKLPQGAPTSPAISNALCKRLDARLGGWCAKHGFVLTRYADDVTLSSKNRDINVGEALAVVRRLVVAEGFVVHADKVRVVRSGGRQEVTGVVVNQKLSVPRDQLRKFRALLFQIEKDGPMGKVWNGVGQMSSDGDVLQSARGFASYVNMVDPSKGAPLLRRIAALMIQYSE
jgi:RNA-directed DNA polymerase